LTILTGTSAGSPRFPSPPRRGTSGGCRPSTRWSPVHRARPCGTAGAAG